MTTPIDRGPIIETHDLQRTFRSRKTVVEAVRGVDLVVGGGEIFGFLGPNGAGKTTALSILIGLTSPTRGEARISGFNIIAEGMEVRRRTGFLRQDPRFYGWMTGKETLRFTGRLFGLDAGQIDRRADDLLDLVDLTGAATRKMGSYSGGMRQRLGIAQALMGKPEVLLLDEPCSALDPAGRFEVIGILERLRGTTTVCYSTHILQDVERVADHVAIVVGGRRVCHAPMHELLTGSRALILEVEGDLVALLADLRRQPYVERAEGNAVAESRLSRIRLDVADVETARRSIPPMVLAHDVVFVALKAEQRTLEEVFLELTGSADSIRDAA
ncbi:MAG: ABC transporter ATP-binding protein [Thermomicrobiales bacterium]